MAVILVGSTTTLNAGNHVQMHNTYTIDSLSPSQVVYVSGGTGNVGILAGSNQPAAALDVYGDIIGSGQAWSNYSGTSAIVGINPTISNSIYTKKIGKTVLVNYNISGVTSGSSVSFGVPFIASANPSSSYFPTFSYIFTSGTHSSMSYLLASSTTVICLSGASTSVFTSGTASVLGNFCYQSI